MVTLRHRESLPVNARFLILGIAVFHVLMFGIGHDGDQTQLPQVLNNILSLLGGRLAAITGF